eukprot:CAMPEP_0118647030 /NCGR_PEP_ID=MMETSP0785-20121206/8386_1 /TAXON_ID=91992 /ORGANISM="Bolidomonas pacifica, Strain CCMP 1866" /LENGTH=921 /DNA_ID=CAMNT_0006539091 /DNA_START=195 /DNA_END=2957 /DNA_ORIENTATION=+
MPAVRAMPLAAAKKTQGHKTKGELAEEQRKRIEELNEKNAEARQEFDLNEDEVSRYELLSWYGFDFANSVYSTVGMSMFIPLLMYYLADNHACPYEFLPVRDIWFTNESGIVTNETDLNFELYDYYYWNGHLNESTSCNMPYKDRYPETAGLSNQHYGSKINGGLSYYPGSISNAYNGASNPFHHPKFPDEDFYEDPTDPLKGNATCNTSTYGDYEWGFVGNISSWSSACEEEGGENLMGEGCRQETLGSYFQPQRGYVEYKVELSNLAELGGSFTFTAKSSNENILNLTGSESFDISNPLSNIEVSQKTEIGDDTETPKDYFVFKFRPNKLRIGSTTIEIQTESNTNKTSAFSFTYNTLPFIKCPYRVKFGLINIRPYSFATIIISLSVMGQALAYFSTCAFGDYGPFRKLLLCYSSIGGCMSSMMFIACDTPDKYILSGVLAIVSNTFFGTSYLFYNAFLPYLTRSHPTFLDAKFEYKNVKTGAATGVGAASKKLLDTYHDVLDHVSAEGFFWGYLSGCFLCFACIGVVFMFPSNGIQMSLFIMGLWWFVFALPMFFCLKTRPGPEFPADVKSNALSAMTFSWRRIIASLYSMRHIPETVKFLIAYFWFSDGINTVANVAILFASDELNMNILGLTILAAEGPFFGTFGMKMFRFYQVKKKKSTKEMLILALWVLLTLPVYSFLNYFNENLGLAQANEMFLVCIVYGLTLGPVQSYARTFYTDLIPPGQEAEYFGVFEISDRGSSWIGPLVAAAFYEAFGTVRHAMWYLFVIISFGMWLTYQTDELKGSDACRRKEILVRMVADRKKFGIHKAGAPPSAKKMAGLKSSKLYTGQSGYSNQSGMSTTSTRSTRSSASSVESSERSKKFSVFKKNKVAQEPEGGFGNATVVEDTNDDGGGFGNATVVEDTNDDGGGGFGNQ